MIGEQPSSCGASRNGLRGCEDNVDVSGSPARTVFGNVVKVIPTNDNRSVHFGGHNLAGEDAATNRDVASEGAFLVWLGD